jgi:hypothetical protein
MSSRGGGSEGNAERWWEGGDLGLGFRERGARPMSREAVVTGE